MATTKKRIQISLTDDQYAAIERVSEKYRVPMSTVVTDMLSVTLPALDVTQLVIDGYEDAHAGLEPPPSRDALMVIGMEVETLLCSR